MKEQLKEIQEDLSEIKVDIAEIKQDLRYHIRRTDNLEKMVTPLHLFYVWFSKSIIILGGGITAIYYILEVFKHLK